MSPYSAFFVTEISTHSLTRRLTPVLGFCTLLHHFNSQPHKEADPSTELTHQEREDFNSQPHKEADRSLLNVVVSLEISTHSLTRRLTILKARGFKGKNISTHSLTRRLTAISDKNIFIQN